jgi:hypothetical protein
VTGDRRQCYVALAGLELRSVGQVLTCAGVAISSYVPGHAAEIEVAVLVGMPKPPLASPPCA